MQRQSLEQRDRAVHKYNWLEPKHTHNDSENHFVTFTVSGLSEVGPYPTSVTPGSVLKRPILATIRGRYVAART